jgi:hypothetical protein
LLRGLAAGIDERASDEKSRGNDCRNPDTVATRRDGLPKFIVGANMPEE